MIIGLFPELLAPGGVQRAGRHTSAVLSDYAQQRGVPYQFLSLNDPAGLHQITVGGHCVAFRGFGRSKAQFALSAVILARQRPQLVLAAHPNLAPLTDAVKLLRPKLRIIVVSHGVEVWSPLSRLRRLALRRADIVLAPSHDTAQRLLIVQGILPGRVRLLPWGLDPEFCTDALKALSSQPLVDSPCGRTVLTVGRLAADERYKGVDTLITATAQLLPAFPDLQLVIVGDGDDRPRLHRMATDLGITEHVQFLGWLPLEALLSCYAQCDVFAMPSRGEGFGLVFLEAMAMGKPVVGGAHGGTPDIIKDGRTGFLVEHGNVEHLSLVLAQLLRDDNLRRAMGERGRQRVYSTYLYDHFAKRFKDILGEVCTF